MKPEPTNNKHIPQPKNEPNTHALPSAVTFFMSVQERRELLRTLQPIAQNRSHAILIAMGICKNDNKLNTETDDTNG